MRKKTSILHQQVKEVQYLKDRCIICQEDLYEKLHKVEFEKTSQHMLEIAKALTVKRFSCDLIPYQTLPMRSPIMCYHLTCWVASKRKAQPLKKDSVQELTNFHQVASDIELINYVSFMLDQGNILDMNTLHEKYKK